jgi:hypothetical protein
MNTSYKNKSILYIGKLGSGETSRMRFEALNRLGHQVEGIDTSWPNKGVKRFFTVLLNKFALKNNIDPNKANRKAISFVKTYTPDLVWVDKGITIKPATLKKIKKISQSTILISYLGDDMKNVSKIFRRYHDSIPYYDYHLTTKSFNVAEFLQAGAKKIVFLISGFDKTKHFPDHGAKNVDQYKQIKVGFVGAYEKDRAEILKQVAESGIKVDIWGPGEWEKLKHDNLVFHEERVYGDSYRHTISNMWIALGFLRKESRDLHTSRSTEIPACRTMFLAERTTEHTYMFDEGKNAEFFSSPDELIKKLKYYLNNKKIIDTIAEQGYKKCLEAKWDYDSQIEKVLLSLYNPDNIDKRVINLTNMLLI